MIDQVKRWTRRDRVWGAVLLVMLLGVVSTWYRVGFLPAMAVVLICILWAVSVGRLIR
jgi:hypothetical protein